MSVQRDSRLYKRLQLVLIFYDYKEAYKDRQMPLLISWLQDFITAAGF